jgi:hypothetical protein
MSARATATLEALGSGTDLATGHPMDGLLEASGWYGKQFDDVDLMGHASSAAAIAGFGRT